MENDTTKKEPDFISYIAHELRAPLASMRWNTEMLMDGTLGEISEDQKKVLSQIHDGNKRIADTINKLLDIVHTENGKYVLSKDDIDIVPILNDVIIKYEKEAEEKGIIVKINSPLSYLINFDKKSFQIIAEAFVSNCIKYSKQGGVANIFVQAGNELLLEFYDEGVGIPEDDKDKIGKEMFRASNIKNSTNGTGLSLVLVNKILSLTGGAFVFTSTENEGSKFEVRIPTN
jgi:signal transduction histidine kinase